ncbi:MAG: BTAD domain-containing putative transcriptional regulator [Gaiellaceae bacterium]
MDFRILGPLEVEENGRSLAPSGRKARALLAVLLIHANEPISADRLIDEVWGEELPENAAKSLQIQISRLRKTVGGERLRTGARGGYELVVHSDELDRDRAVTLVERGRALLEDGKAADAGSAFADALALFRGRPLEEFAREAFAHAEIERLEELRLSASEGVFESELSRGRGARIVGELESRIAETPLRERLREQLMVALYQAGRQADALAVYAEARRAFAEELGIEPGPTLRELERRILNQDSTLRPRLDILQRRVRPKGRALALLGAAALAAVAAAVAIGFASRSSNPALTLPPRSLGVLDPRTLEVRAVVDLDAELADVAIGRKAVFIALPGRRSVMALDPDTNASTTLGTAVRPGRLAAGRDGLWLLDTRSRRVALLGSTRIYELGEAPSPGTAPLDAIAADHRDVWLAELDAEYVYRLDRRTGRSSAIDNGGSDSFFDGAAQRALAIGAGSLWASNPVTTAFSNDRLGRISRIDLRTGEVTARVRLPAPPLAIVADADAVWVSLERGQDLWRIDPRDEIAAAAVRLAEPVAALALGEGAVWALGEGGTVSRIDPTTNAVTEQVDLGRGIAIAAGHGGVWVVSR